MIFQERLLRETDCPELGAVRCPVSTPFNLKVGRWVLRTWSHAKGSGDGDRLADPRQFLIGKAQDTDVLQYIPGWWSLAHSGGWDLHDSGTLPSLYG